MNAEDFAASVGATEVSALLRSRRIRGLVNTAIDDAEASSNARNQRQGEADVGPGFPLRRKRQGQTPSC